MTENSLLASFDCLWHYGLPASSPCLISSSIAPTTRPVAAKSEVGSLQSLFSVLDEDGDGRLRLCEMHSLLTRLHLSSPSTNLESFIKRTASNHINADDGVSLDFPQFARLYQSLFVASHDCPSQGPVQCEDDVCFHGELLDAFCLYDTNGDGFISAEELGVVLLELGLLPAEHVGRCQAYIDQVDLNGDGMVDLNEFRFMMIPKHL